MVNGRNVYGRNQKFSKKNIELAKISLNQYFLPWVESAKHVGNILERDNFFNKEIRSEMGSFIGRVHSPLGLSKQMCLGSEQKILKTENSVKLDLLHLCCLFSDKGNCDKK